jgi:hypothetical protein
MRLMMRVGGGLIVLLCVAVITATSFRARNVTDLKQRGDVQLPVKAQQIQSEGEVTPVELWCGTVSVTTSSTLNDLSCTLKNNTDRNIVGANLAYSIVYEQAGKELKDTRFHTLVTSIQPDFYEKAKSISSGGVLVIKLFGSLTYENSIIKGVELYIDYIEFEDGTSLGPNENGSRIIKDFRDGASEYKNWLTEKYKSKSMDELIQLLQSDQPFPELKFKNSHQEQGAAFYRKRLRKILETRGRAEVEKHLSK